MVSVPITTQGTRQVQPLGRERFQYAAPRNLVGQAMEGFGEAIGDFAEAQAVINEKRDEAETKKADVEAEVERAQVRARILATENFDAVGARDLAKGEYKKIRDKYVGELSNPRQRKMFEQVFRVVEGQDLATIAAHEVRQVVAAEKGASTARISTYTDRAVELRDNPEASATALATALGEVEKRYGSDGPDVVAMERATVTSAYRVRVADALADKDPISAEEYVNLHAPEILETDETTIRRRLRPGVEEAELDDAMEDVEGIVRNEESTDPLAPEPAQERTRVASWSADPLRGRGRVTATPAQHLKRGRLALDLAAPAGTPIYPPMGGKVVDKGFKADGNGHYVRVKHPNGVTTTYLHMRSASPVDVGEQIDGSTVIGSVGSTGKSTGNHLDYSASKGGVALNPLKVKWDEPDLPALPAYRAERNDAATLYAAARKVATERNFTPRQYDGLLRRVDAMVTREDRLKARDEDDAIRSAMDVVDRLGEGFTRKDQIANWSALPPTTRIQLTGLIEQNTKPKPIDANGDTALTFELMSVADPAKFAGSDLRLYRHQMTTGEFASLATKQAQIKTKGTGAPVVADHGRIWGMINRYGPDVGLEPTSKDKDDRKRSHRVFEAVRDDLNRLTDGKRQPTDDEVKAAFDRATMEVIVRGGGFLGIADNRVRRFDADPADKAAVEVPRDVHDRIVASYRRQTGRVPSEQEIGQTFMAHKGKPGFW